MGIKEIAQLEKEGYIIKNYQGGKNDFVLYPGLIHLSHLAGMTGVNTELVQCGNKSNEDTTIFKATVSGVDPETKLPFSYSGYGDASPKSVKSSKILPHLIRMAETRAIARAMRILTDIGLTAMEELDLYVAEGTATGVAKPLEQEKPATKAKSKKLTKAQETHLDIVETVRSEANKVLEMSAEKEQRKVNRAAIIKVFDFILGGPLPSSEDTEKCLALGSQELSAALDQIEGIRSKIEAGEEINL